MKSLAVALALSLAAAGARAQQTDTSSGSYGRSNKSRNSAGSRIGGHPTNPPEIGSSAEGRARAGYDVGVASAKGAGAYVVGLTRTVGADRMRGADELIERIDLATMERLCS